MRATVPSTCCRLVIADRGFQRHGLAKLVNDAGFPVHDSFREVEHLRALGLLEMDVLLEIDGGQRALADFFPAAFGLKAWKAFVTAHSVDRPPTLVLARKEGQDPTRAHAANQEVVTMLQSILQRSPTQTLPGAASADTVCDVASPLALAPAQNPLARVAGEVAHDLNNMLTIIRDHCRLLHTLVPERGQALVQEISKAEEQASLLTQHLGSASRSETRPTEVYDLHALLENSAGMLRGLLGSRHGLVVRLAAQPCPVRLAVGQMERVLANLAVNARDAMPDGGTLTLSTELVDLDPPMALAHSFISGPHVLVTLADTGTGLDERHRARLFKPRASAKFGGKGLGLAIVAGIVHGHQGHIEVESQPGVGTSFHIFLPLVPSSEDAVPRPQPVLAPGSETVMLVEDEPMVRSIFRRILQEHGYFVLEAADGAEAVFLAQQFFYPIQLLITDVAMPRMNGVELAGRMAALHPETQVLFLSGYSDGVLPGQDPPDKNIAFLQKPFKAEALVQKVREVLRQAG